MILFPEKFGREEVRFFVRRDHPRRTDGTIDLQEPPPGSGGGKPGKKGRAARVDASYCCALIACPGALALCIIKLVLPPKIFAAALIE